VPKNQKIEGNPKDIENLVLRNSTENCRTEHEKNALFRGKSVEIVPHLLA
jgi:hypothetical protein